MTNNRDKPSEITDITQFVGHFKSRIELQKYAEMLFLGFKESIQKLQALEEENKHLKTLLASNVPEITQVTKLVVPDEQAIAEIQLKKLKETAMERELTLDETKRFDILTKNLYLSKGKPTKVIDADKADKELSEAELIDIAKTKNE